MCSYFTLVLSHEQMHQLFQHVPGFWLWLILWKLWEKIQSILTNFEESEWREITNHCSAHGPVCRGLIFFFDCNSRLKKNHFISPLPPARYSVLCLGKFHHITPLDRSLFSLWNFLLRPHSYSVWWLRNFDQNTPLDSFLAHRNFIWPTPPDTACFGLGIFTW